MANMSQALVNRPSLELVRVETIVASVQPGVHYRAADTDEAFHRQHGIQESSEPTVGECRIHRQCPLITHVLSDIVETGKTEIAEKRTVEVIYHQVESVVEESSESTASECRVHSPSSFIVDGYSK